MHEANLLWKKFVPFRKSMKGKLARLRSAGDEAQRRRAWSESIPFYKEYLGYRDHDAAIWVQLGHAQKELGNLGEAEAAYRRAMIVAPEDGDSVVHLIPLLRRLGKNAEADALQRGESLPVSVDSGGPSAPATANTRKRSLPKKPMSNRTRGDAARDNQQWAVAGEFYADHLSEHLGDAPIWVQLGHVLKEQGLLDEAVYAYSMGRHLDEADLDVAEHLSSVLVRLGRPVDARPLWSSMFQKHKTFFLQAK